MVDNMLHCSEKKSDVCLYEFISQLLRQYFYQVDHGNLCAIEDAVNDAMETKIACGSTDVREYIESCCRNINRFRKLCEAFVHGYEKCNGRHISNPEPFYIIFQLLGICSSKNSNIKSREAYQLSFLRSIFAKISSEVSIQLQEFVQFICDANKYEEFVAPLLLKTYEPKFIYESVISSLQEISCSMKEEILTILSDKTVSKAKECNKTNTCEKHKIEENTSIENNYSSNDMVYECIDNEEVHYSEQLPNTTINFNDHDGETEATSTSEESTFENTSRKHGVNVHTHATSTITIGAAADKNDTMRKERNTKYKNNNTAELPPAEVREMALTLPTIQKKNNKKIVCIGASSSQMQEKSCEYTNDNTQCSSIRENNSKSSSEIHNLTFATKNDKKIVSGDCNDNKKNINSSCNGEGYSMEENSYSKAVIEPKNKETEEQGSRKNASPITKVAAKCSNKTQELIEVPQTKATLLKLYALIEEEKREKEKRLEEKQYRSTNKAQVCKTERSNQADINPLLDDWEKEEQWEKEYEEEEEEYEKDTAAVAELARQKAEREIELYKRHLEELEAAERRAEAKHIAQQQKREELSKAKDEWKKQIAKLNEEHQADLNAQRSFVTKLRSQIKEQVKQAEANVQFHNDIIAQEVKSESERLLAFANAEKQEEAKKRMTMIQEIKLLRERLREQRQKNARIKNKTHDTNKNGQHMHLHWQNNCNKIKHCHGDSEDDSDNYVDSDDDDEGTSERSSSSSSSNKFQEYNMSELEVELMHVRAENERLLQWRKENINAQRSTNREMKKILSSTCSNELKRRSQLRLERQKAIKARLQRTMEWKKTILQTRLAEMHDKLSKRQESRRQEYEQSKVDARYKHKLYQKYECKNNELEQRR